MTNESPLNRPGDIAYDWWSRLVSGESGYHRAALARIRRAGTPLEVIQEPVALRLVVRLGAFDPDRVAVLAGVLAYVRQSPQAPLTRAVGCSRLDDEQSAVLSSGRFRRLLQAEPHELLDQMRRVVTMSKGEANVRHLAVDILRWGDAVKQRWIFEYYGLDAPHQQSVAAPSAPRQ